MSRFMRSIEQAVETSDAVVVLRRGRGGRREVDVEFPAAQIIATVPASEALDAAQLQQLENLVGELGRFVATAAGFVEE